MKVRRLEGGGGGEISMGEGKERVEDGRCKTQKEIVGRIERATQSRIVRRGGRVSNIVKTLEEGSKQNNKILSYLT